MSSTAEAVRVPAIVSLWLFMACVSGPDESALLKEEERRPALLAFYGDTTSVELPASTRVREATTLRFTSFGGGCIRKDITDVEVSGLEAEVRPNRVEPRELPPNTACTMELRIDEHVVQLRFSQPGIARVRIVGLARPGDHPFSVERELVVAP